MTVDPEAMRRTFAIDPDKKHPLRLLGRSEPYLLMGFIPMQRKLLTIEGQGTPLLLLGADRLGRDVLSRLIIGTRVSLSVGLVGVVLSLAIGLVVGGLSGYYGGLSTWSCSGSSSSCARCRRYPCGWGSPQHCRATGHR
ncbi:MAG: hypothetical protein R3D25_13535 [Geminicoccaceae bacterium]